MIITILGVKNYDIVRKTFVLINSQFKSESLILQMSFSDGRCGWNSSCGWIRKVHILGNTIFHDKPFNLHYIVLSEYV